MTDSRRRHAPVDTANLVWIPHVPRTATEPRVRDTSCCGAFELGAEGGQYFVLKRTGDGYEETGRGTYAHASAIYTTLASQHRCSRQRTF
ncbi:hypothetical protein AB0L44_14935 [Nonomuraea wenchangensis]|uniref:hypothetical protein n=1 Tax=Nonomuraea wenchangensis TaxID=568860 RepID=UPI003424C1D8